MLVENVKKTCFVGSLSSFSSVMRITIKMISSSIRM